MMVDLEERDWVFWRTPPGGEREFFALGTQMTAVQAEAEHGRSGIDERDDATYTYEVYTPEMAEQQRRQYNAEMRERFGVEFFEDPPPPPT